MFCSAQELFQTKKDTLTFKFLFDLQALKQAFFLGLKQVSSKSFFFKTHCSFFHQRHGKVDVHRARQLSFSCENGKCQKMTRRIQTICYHCFCRATRLVQKFSDNFFVVKKMRKVHIHKSEICCHNFSVWIQFIENNIDFHQQKIMTTQNQQLIAPCCLLQKLA